MATRAVLDDLDTALAVIAQLKLDREHTRVRAEDAEARLFALSSELAAAQQALAETEQRAVATRSAYEARIRQWHEEAKQGADEFEQIRQQVCALLPPSHFSFPFVFTHTAAAHS